MQIIISRTIVSSSDERKLFIEPDDEHFMLEVIWKMSYHIKKCFTPIQ